MSRRCGGMEIRNGKDNGKDCSLSKGKRICVSGFRNYGGLANTWSYGNLGVELKNNVKKRNGGRSSFRKVRTMSAWTVTILMNLRHGLLQGTLADSLIR